MKLIELNCYKLYCICKVPPSDNCTNIWLKNTTSGEQSWYFIWNLAETDEEHSYQLCYYVYGTSKQCLQTDSRFKRVYDFDYTIGTSVIQGTVSTRISNAYSAETNCTAVTLEPTQSPIPIPTAYPTTGMPSPSPTFGDSYVFIGGDICSEDRCECYGFELSCVGENIFTEWRYVLKQNLHCDLMDYIYVFF